ncbi:MAG: hypothetical protein IB618_02455 [Candidatus Pacearchaeota archaeon]|nr:MAG: hypothetical protein IB618_02455 [Candidatus Pacearchaeota archaeon]
MSHNMYRLTPDGHYKKVDITEEMKLLKRAGKNMENARKEGYLEKLKIRTEVVRGILKVFMAR